MQGLGDDGKSLGLVIVGINAVRDLRDASEEAASRPGEERSRRQAGRQAGMGNVPKTRRAMASPPFLKEQSGACRALSPSLPLSPMVWALVNQAHFQS